MKEAVLYKKLPDKSVRCNLCSHRCLIRPGKRGICSVRENRDGTLYSLVYGLAMATNVDPIEKKPLFHFLPGTKSFSICTAGCNFRCEFCQNWQESQATKTLPTIPGIKRLKFRESTIPGQKLSPQEIVKQAIETGCRSIAYTYTEPTIFFEYAADTAKLAKKEGLANVFVSNGYQTPETIEKMKGLIDAVNIDLKSFSDEFYKKVCGARLQPVLDSIKLMHKAGIWVEITTLIIPNQNDSSGELTQIARFLASIDVNIPWHISRFHPDYQMLDSQPTPLQTLEMAYQIGKKAGLNYVYLGNIVTKTGENTYCPKCGNLAIQRIGYEVEALGIDKNGCCEKCGENLNINIALTI